MTSGIETGSIGILIFSTGPYRLGINLGKVREIIKPPNIKDVPYSHPVVQGVFELRNRLIPALSLRNWLGEDDRYPDSARVIITEFLGLQVGFMVDGVERIHRAPWDAVEPPVRIQRFSRHILAAVKLEDGLITLIDYEHIVLSINPDAVLAHTQTRKDSKALTEKRKTKSIWILEDSKTIRDFLKEHLKKNGYTNIIFFENGKHALDTLDVVKTRLKHGDDSDKPDVIITDIEMPVMDGYTFIQSVKTDEALRRIPIVLFSSLITSENKLKGEIADADAQLAKSDSANLVPLMDRFIFSAGN